MRLPPPTALKTLCLMVLLGCSVQAQNVTFERVWPSYRDAASFTRVLEYFGGSPDTTNRDAVRSQPDQRAGYYWLVRTHATTALADCTVQIKVHRVGTTAPATHTFPFPVSSGSHAINVGLTGTDWSDPTERPIAWQLTLLSPSNSVLATQQSFLWQRQTP